VKWDEYYRRYRVFALSMHQTNLVAVVASKALANFPASLPREWRTSVADAFRDAGTALLAAVEQAEQSGQSVEVSFAKHAQEKEHSDLIIAGLDLIKGASLLGTQGLDVAPMAFAQQLTMSFAHMAAFMSDSVRAICHARPAILKNDRKIEWRTVIDAGDWDALISKLVEDYVFSFGWDSIRKCALNMRERFGLKLDVPDESLARIEDAELIRNVIVHAGGRASAEYLKRSGRTDLSLGDPVPLEPAFVRAVATDMERLAGQILLDVLETHFGVERHLVTGVPVRGTRARAESKPPRA
jgi:hypothetical protein